MNTPATLPRPRAKASRALAALIAGLSLSALPAAFAQTNGTWSVTAAGNWSDTTKWTDGIIASGTGAIANFNVLTNQSINLDTNRIVGRINFTNSAGNVLSSSNGSVLTLATSTGVPVIDGSGTISVSIAGNQGLSFQPGGFRDLTLSGNNTYTGVTSIASGGRIFIRSNNALGASGAGNGTSITYADNANVQLIFNSSASALNVAEDFQIRMTASGGGDGTTVGRYLIVNENAANSTTLTGALVLDRASATTNGRASTNFFGVQAVGTLNLEGDISATATAGQTTSTSADPTRLQVRTTAATANINISGVISDGTLTTGGLSVYTAADSSGIVRLTAANTYSGSTVHQKGTLLVNNTTGSGTGTGSVTVANTAIFGGTGISAPTGSNSIVFATGSIVAPGDVNDSGAAIAAGESLGFDLSGTTGNVTFESGAAISINLNASIGNVAESLAFIGLVAGQADVAFNNNLVNFSITGGLLADGLYTLVSFDAANAYSGQLVLGSGLESYTASLIHGANGIQLAIGVIPEPSVASLAAGLAVLGFATAGRRRRA